MTRSQPVSLKVEKLEDRSTPAIVGQPWLDGRHLTVSFAADGTLISGVGSDLSTPFSSLGSNAARLEMLRAFQTWAVWSNLNVGLMADSNLPFGTPGAIQGDPRFGDIRIGARSLGGDVTAVTTPFSLVTPSSGDMIINGSKSFSIGGSLDSYDLFSVMVHEAGHAFGLGHSIDPASVMYEQYLTAHSGLSSGDIANIRTLYGDRAPDGYEGSTGNDTYATATTYAGALEADLTTNTDVDMYRWTADSSDGRWFRLKAEGLSLVTAKLEVLDAMGQVVGSAQADGPLQNDVTVYVSQLIAGATYYLRVSSARDDVFGVGAYRLAVDTTATQSNQTDSSALVDGETGGNDTIANAAVVAPSGGPYGYSFRSSLSSSTDVDYFSVHSPSNATGNTTLTINVSTVGGAAVSPAVGIYSTTGDQLSFKTVARTGSSVVIEVDGLSPDTDYVVRVANSSTDAGNYDFVATFTAAGAPTMLGATGSLSDSFQTASALMTVYQSQTIQINQIATVQDNANTISLVRIYDAQNQVVFQLYSISGQQSTGQVFLARGQYRIEVQNLTTSDFAFSLTIFGVTDPIGSSSTDPTGIPTDPTTTGTPPPPPPPDDTTTVTVTPPPATLPTVTWF